MAGLRLSLLGAFEATLDGKPLTGIKTDKARALLIYLAVERGRLHRRQALAGLLWPDYPENGARANLRHALANLRQVLGEEQNQVPFLLVEGETIQFNTESDYWVDVAAFDDLAAASQSEAGQAGPAIDDLQATIGLYRGGFLEGFALKDSPDFDNWTYILRERYLGQASAALGKLAEGYEQSKDYEKAISFARRRLELEPWQEQAHFQLMRLLALSGQRAAALAQYETCLKVIKEELGVEPSVETRRLHASIRDGGIEGSKQAKIRQHNLPAQLTSFIGREKEIVQVKSLLEAHRLVTLTGPGGTGKTRLSLQVAAGLLEQFPDGVWLVELAPLADPGLVVEAAAQAVGMRLASNPQALSFLQDYLEPKYLLLILDNCEHLIEACARLADALLHACPHLHILATSREALGIDGETSFRVPPLAIPEAGELPAVEALIQYEAVCLFVERASAALPGFRLTLENASPIAQVCQRLDGIPLALELAAARVKVLRVEEIAVRLDDRFRLLTGGSRLALPRNQTLRASIDWSFNLLSSEERSLLQRLSIFAGGWTLEAAEFVGCGDGIESCEVLDFLGQLVNKSLVTVETGESIETRYRMLETIRQYAHEKLVESGESESVRDRHLAYFVELAERFEGKIRGPDMAVIMSRLEAELDNLRLVLGWSLEAKSSTSRESTSGRRVENGLRLASALRWFWHFRGGCEEGLQWLERLLAAELEEGVEQVFDSARTQLRAKALFVAGHLAGNLREDQKSNKLVDESRILFQELGPDGKSGYAYVLSRLGCVEESLAIFQEIGDKFGISECLSNLGRISTENQEYMRARIYFEESLALKKDIGDQDGIAWSLFLLGAAAFLQNDYEKARILWEESRAIFSELGTENASNAVIMNLGFLEWIQGNFVQAERDFSAILRAGRRLADIMGINTGLSFLGKLALSLGHSEEAAIRFEENLAVSDKHEFSYPISVSLNDLGNFYWSVGDYERAEERFTEGLAVVGKSGLGDEDAGHVFGLVRVAFARGEYKKAWVYLQEAFGLRQWPRGSIWDASFSILEACAFLAARRQEKASWAELERAARLLGATDGWHIKWQLTRTPRERQDRESAIAAVWQALGEDAFTKAWEEGKAMTLEQAIAYAKEGDNT